MKKESAQSIHDGQEAFSFVPVKECYACKLTLPEPNYANKQWLSDKGRCRACIHCAQDTYEDRHNSSIEELGHHIYWIGKSRLPRVRMERELRVRGYHHMILVCRLDTDVHYISPRTCAVDYRALRDGLTVGRVIEALDSREIPVASAGRSAKLRTNAELRLKEAEVESEYWNDEQEEDYV